jgi:hypothetical protein
MPTTRSSTKKTEQPEQIGEKRQHHKTAAESENEEPESKSVKHESDQKDASNGKDTKTKQSTKQQKATDGDDSKKTEALEKGHIYFFYRPKVIILVQQTHAEPYPTNMRCFSLPFVFKIR